MQLSPHEVAIGILANEFGEGYSPDPRTCFTREEAIEFLRDLTGEEFGADAAQWKAWFASLPDEYRNLCYEEYGRKKTEELRKRRAN